MANNLNTLREQLKQVQQEAKSTTNRVYELATALDKLLRTASEKGGGAPISENISQVTAGLLKGELQPGGRFRLGGGSRIRTTQISEKINDIINRYIAEIANQKISELQNQLLLSAKASPSSIRLGAGLQPPTPSGPTIYGKAPPTRLLLPSGLSQPDLSKSTGGGLDLDNVLRLTTKQIQELSKAAPLAEQQIKVLKKGFDNLYGSMAKFAPIQQQFPRALQHIRQSAQELGITFDNIAIRPSQLSNGFEKLSVTLRNNGQVVKGYKLYLDELGRVLTEVEYKQRTAGQAKYQVPAPGELERAMGQLRYQAALKGSRKYGYEPEQLKKVYTQQPSGVTFLQYEKDVEGVLNRMTLTVDKFGGTLVSTNRRLLDFFQSIARNTMEVIKWSIGATAVYQALFKLQDLVRVAIDNEAKLADVTVTLGNSQRNVNDIFTDASAIAVRTGESINGVLEAYTAAYRAVGSIADPTERTASANKLLSDSVILAKLSALDQVEAIDVLSGSLRQLGEPLTNGTKLLDQWITLTRNANVDLSTLAIAFSVTSESAINAGVSVAELNGIIASLSEKIGGLGGKETGNAVRALIGGIYQEQAAVALQRYGISVRDAVGEMRPFLDISREIFDLWKGGVISDDQLNKLAYTLGGGVRRGQQYVAFLTDLNKVQEFAAIQANSAGVAQEALGRKLDTVQTSVTNLSNSFQNLAQAVGSEGGVLDITRGLLEVFTGVNNILAEVTRNLGKITIPATVLALGSLYFRGPAGQAKYGALQSGISSGMGGGLANLLFNLPYFNQQGAGGFSRATNIGQRFGNFAGQYGPGIAVGAIPALSRFGAGQTGAGFADIGGAIVGTILAKGNIIGGVVGGAIAEYFVSETMTYEPEFQRFFAQMFPQAKGTTDVADEDERKKLTKEIFATAGLGSESLGIAASRVYSDLYNIASNIRSKITGQGFGQLTPEQASLMNATPEQRGRIQELNKQTPVTVNVEQSRAYQEQIDLANKYGDTLDKLRDKLRKQQLEQLFKRDINARQYAENILDIQGFDSALTKMAVAFGENFDKMNSDISGTGEVFEVFADILLKGSEEDTKYIKDLTEEIIYLKAAIDAAKKTGQPIDFRGMAVDIAEANVFLQENISLVTQLVLALEKEQKIRETKLPQVVGLDLKEQDLSAVLREALNLENLYKSALTPDERAKYEAEQELANVLLEIYTNAGKQFYKDLDNKGPGADFITKAFQKLSEEGKISPFDDKGIGFQKFDVPYSQFQSQVDTRYEDFARLLESMGYKRDEQEQIAIFNDGIIRPMNKDWKIVQFLLQEILDTEKKQLDGIYNLPTDASFYVPFQGYELGFANQTASIDELLNSFRALGDKLTEDVEQSRAIQKEDNLGKAQIRDRLAHAKAVSERVAETPYDERDVVESQGYKGLRARRTIDEYAPKPTIESQIQTAIDNLRVSLENKLQTLIDINRGIPDFINKLLGIDTGDKTIDKNIGKDTGAGATKILPSPAPLSLADIKLPKVETALNLNINSSTNLIVDGRLLANIVKQYLFADLIRSENTTGTTVRTVSVV